MDNEKPESQRPKAYHHGDLRKTLISAGLELLSEGGTATLDLRKVARMANVSHAAPYRHFADKQALVAAIIEEGFLQLSAQIQAARHAAADDSLAQLHAVAEAYVHFAVHNPPLLREMFSGLSIDRKAYPSLYPATKSVFKQYAEVLQRGQERGTIIDGDPRELAGVFWSLLHGVAMLFIEGQMGPLSEAPDGLEKVTKSAIQILYHGIGRQPLIVQNDSPSEEG
jgi:AcrR family transcriptional regulator